MINLDGSTIQIIKHAWKCPLFDSSGVWVKNNDNPLFDVTKCSFNGTEVCELVDLCLLSKVVVHIMHIDSDNIGLYRDDGLVVINNANGTKPGRLRKKYIIATFKVKGWV